jgi:hypothetical protein
MIRRVHLFEFNDQRQLPKFMTSWMTSILRVCHQETRDGTVWAPKVIELLEKSGQKKIVDLCSGGGGPVLDLVRILKENYNLDIQLTLTDLIPNLQSAAEMNQQGKNIRYVTDSISAANVPNDLQGVRTMFSGLHHMKPEIAFNLLKNAFDNKQYIFIGETTSRTKSAMICYGYAPKYFFEMTKQITPTVLQRFFTFVIPILPIMLGWDNIVSCLRSYTFEELKEFTERLSSDDYCWEMGRLNNPVLNLPYTYLMGYPRT